MPWPTEIKSLIVQFVDGGLSVTDAVREVKKKKGVTVPHSTARGFIEADARKAEKQERIAKITGEYTTKPEIEAKVKASIPNGPRILVFDIETIPNAGFFFDIFSDRGIPLQFVDRPKSVCTIAYKWYGEEESHVFVVDEPYNDKDILEQFRPVWEQAEYAIGHYGEGFDLPFIAGRMAANGLSPLAPLTIIDTYKLAKKHFGRTLNSNKLDHLGEIFGVGKKNKTDAMLWVRCAKNEKAALKEMALYNIQDVVLLEKVFNKLQPYVRSKINLNLFIDDVTRRCKPCGSENLSHKGYEMTAATMRDRCQCDDCGAWSSFPIKKVAEPTE